nr:glutamate ABC transporter substrate-binding protein [Rothia koreensis]
MAIIGCLSLASCGVGGSDHRIRIGIKFDQPGLGYQDGTGYSGFDVDVATYLAGKLGYSPDQIEWVQSPSANRENMLSNHQVDMIVATYSITDKRKKSVDFAGPYFVAGQDLLVQKSNADIHGPDDLNGKNLCSVQGSTSAAKIKEKYAENANLVELNSYAECIGALEAGRIDALTTDDIILAGLASTGTNKGKFKLTGQTFTEEKYGVGLPKGTTRCPEISKAITSMVDDGSWEKFVSKNTEGSGYEFDAKANPPKPTEGCA